jgi:hypothetical protein
MSESAVVDPEVFVTERRAQDVIAQLSRQFDAVCRRSHEPGQIAAALEAAGYSDRTAQIELGESTTFAVAEKLFQMVPKRRRSITRSIAETHPQLFVVLRAFFFTLPGIMTILVVPSFGARSNAILMVLSLIYGWSVNQVMGYLGYRTLYEFSSKAAATVLRRALMFACIPWALVVGGFALFGATSTIATSVATGQVLYFLCAAVMRVVNREKILLVSLVPALAAGPLALVGQVDLAEISLGVALAICCLWTVSIGGSSREVTVRAQLKRHRAELLVRGTHGALCAFIVGVSAIMLQISGVHTSGPSPDLAVLPIVLAMTLSEAQLTKFRTKTVEIMRRPVTLREFRVQIQRELVIAARRYVYVGAVVAIVAAALLQLAGRMNAIDAIRLAAFTALGGAFFVDIALSAHDYTRYTILPLLFTAIICVGLAVILGETSAGSLVVYGGFCFACFALLYAMLATARALLPDILNYR